MHTHRVNTLLSDPVNARVAWHDAKKHATLLRLLVTNAERGTYGTLPALLRVALTDIQTVIETHSVLLDALSILSRYDNGALVWKPAEGSGEEYWRVAQKRMVHLLGGRAIHADGWEGSVKVDPTLFPFIVTGALTAVLGACPLAAITATLSHVGRVSLQISARDIELPPAPEHLLDAAWQGNVPEEAWQPHGVSLAAIQAVAERAGGSVRLHKQSSEILLAIML